MIVDSSALVAILFEESDGRGFARAIESAQRRRISAASYLETAIVIDARREPRASGKLDDVLRKASIEVVAFDETQARIARQAYRDFGKGNGHRARLNFGDCFAYAAAKAVDEPLLYKGTDFGQTDVRSALS